MTRTYRVVHDPTNGEPRPWIVQGAGTSRGHTDWADIARFAFELDADRYITEVQLRQRIISAPPSERVR